MNRPFTRRLRGRSMVAVTTAAGLGLAGLVLASTPADAAIPVDPDCPDAYPVGDLHANDAVDGLTVSTGTQPDEFTGKVLGVLNDGIAPGVDMIMVTLDSPAIEDAGGIWQGMSGSPVYAANGELIGAVAYGLANGPSPVAGVTPAAAMKKLLDNPAAGVQKFAKTVKLPPKLQAKVAAQPNTSMAEAKSGYAQLSTPIAVSGNYNAKSLKKLAKSLNLSGATFYRAKAAPAAPAASGSDQIFAGSNLAASVSYGDITLAGVGTTTMVCDNKVVGFGHPFFFSGAASYALHGANAIYVQPDSLGSPFKVANPTAPVGAITQDRQAGIAGALGALPATTSVHTAVTYGGVTQTSDSQAPVPDWLSTVEYYATNSGMQGALDAVTKGSALVTYKITGQTPAGPFTLTRTNRYADAYDITSAATWEVSDATDTILNNDFSDVTIDSVDWSSTVTAQPRQYTIAKVQAKIKGKFKTLKANSVVRVKPGKALKLKITLTSRRNAFGSKVVNTSVLLPAKTKVGRSGMLQITGGTGNDEGDCLDCRASMADGPSSFNGLLSSIAKAPRNDQLTAEFDLFTANGLSTPWQKTTQLSDVVTGGFYFDAVTVNKL